MKFFRPYGLIFALVSFSPAQAQVADTYDSPLILKDLTQTTPTQPGTALEQQFYDMASGIDQWHEPKEEDFGPPMVLAPNIYKEKVAVKSLGKKLPLYKTSTTQAKKTLYKEVQANIANAKMFNVEKQDIGLEPRISRSDFLSSELERLQGKYKEPKALETPAMQTARVKKWQLMAIEKAPSVREFKYKDFNVDQVVSKRKILAALPKINLDPDITEQPMVSLTELDKDLLAVYLLNKNDDRCHLTLGLLSKHLKESKESALLLGRCAYKMGLYKLATKQLLSLISEGSEYASEALNVFDKKLPHAYHRQVAKALIRADVNTHFSSHLEDSLFLMMTKEQITNGDHDSAIRNAGKIATTSDHYPQAQILRATGLYKMGKIKDAIATLEQLTTSLSSELQKKHKEELGLATINLARMQFRKGLYKQAFKNYMSLDKSHPLWVQAMMEQGWAQVALGDHSGAIGNMYSLHSPYFHSVYMPESYAIRTIGYLNICQYGDAYRTLTTMEEKHRHWLRSITSFRKTMGTNTYPTVAKYLRGGSQKSVDGLPFQLIREIARQKNFLNTQNDINDVIDEISRHKIVVTNINKDHSRSKWKLKKSNERRLNFKAKVKLAKSQSKLVKNVPQWKAGVRREARIALGHLFEMSLLRKSKKAYQTLHKNMKASLGKDKKHFTLTANKSLAKNLKNMEKQLIDLIDKNEFLRYEIYAGSGQNIRYQVSGGKTAKPGRIPASIRPEKSLNWDFEGEYWEDEIGSYRSSLTNNCPKSGTSKQAQVNY